MKPYHRHWAVYDSKEKLICVTVYKKGAEEVVRRFGDHPKEEEEFGVLDGIMKELQQDQEYQDRYL